MRATILLADAAQACDGKLYILGGGWNITGPAPAPSAIAILVEVPWDRTNVRMPWRLELVDADGNEVMVQGPMGEQAIKLEGELEVGRPPGVKPGTHLPIPLAINIGPLPLEPGGQYQWKLYIDGETQEHWDVTFFMRALQPPTSPAR